MHNNLNYQSDSDSGTSDTQVNAYSNVPPPLPPRPKPKDMEPTPEQVEMRRKQIINTDTGETFDNVEDMLRSMGATYSMLPSKQEKLEEEQSKQMRRLKWPVKPKKYASRMKRTKPYEVKVEVSNKGYSEFSELSLMQEFSVGCKIWAIEFSPDGHLLACAGEDGAVYVYRIYEAMKDVESPGVFGGFESPISELTQSITDTTIKDDYKQKSRMCCKSKKATGGKSTISDHQTQQSIQPSEDRAYLSPSSPNAPYHEDLTQFIETAAWLRLEGHSSDVIDICWSSDSSQLLSASTDSSVRLWIIIGESNGVCKAIFKHPQAVSSIQFHPLYPQVFISGCLDSRIRLWDIVNNRVLNFKDTKEPVTATRFSFDGKLVVVGLLQGHVVFYSEDLRYFTQLECRNRKGPLKSGRAVTGLHIRPYSPGVGPFSPTISSISGGTAPSAARVEVLVTTADSRLRLYTTDTFEMVAKYKGHRHEALHMGARFSEDGRHILSGGEDNRVHIWFTTPTEGSGRSALRGSTLDTHASFLSSNAHTNEGGTSGIDVTNAIFVPSKSLLFSIQNLNHVPEDYVSAAILTSDTEGVVRIFGKRGIVVV